MRSLSIIIFLPLIIGLASANPADHTKYVKNNTLTDNWLKSHQRYRRDAKLCQISKDEYEKMVETKEKDGVKLRKIRIDAFLELYEDAGEYSIKSKQMSQLAKKLILQDGALTDESNFKTLFRQKTGVDPDLNTHRVMAQKNEFIGGIDGFADAHNLPEEFKHRYRNPSSFGEQSSQPRSSASVEYGGNFPASRYQNTLNSIDNVPKTYYESLTHPDGNSLPFSRSLSTSNIRATHFPNSDLYNQFSHADYKPPSLPNIPHVPENIIHSVPTPKFTPPTSFKVPVFRGGKIG